MLPKSACQTSRSRNNDWPRFRGAQTIPTEHWYSTVGVRLHERTNKVQTVVDAGCRVRAPATFDTRSHDCVDTALVRSIPCCCCRTVNTAALLAADLAACVADLSTHSDAVLTSSRFCRPGGGVDLVRLLLRFDTFNVFSTQEQRYTE